MPTWLEPFAWFALVSLAISLGLILHCLATAGSSVERRFSPASLSSEGGTNRAQPLPALPADLAERERENAAHLRACARALRENPHDPLAEAAMTVAFRHDDDLRAVWSEWGV